MAKLAVGKELFKQLDMDILKEQKKQISKNDISRLEKMVHQNIKISKDGTSKFQKTVHRNFKNGTPKFQKMVYRNFKMVHRNFEKWYTEISQKW